MVKLSYAFKLKASFQEVWTYFSHFENIAEYDPCVKSAIVMNKEQNQIGRKYDITTLHHGKEGKMVYEVTKYSETYQGSMRNFVVQLYGSNDKIESTDCITVKQISKSQEDFNLILQYKADISLRGIYWLGTVFAISTFKQVALNAEIKCKTKCEQKWGINNVNSVSIY